MHTCIHVAHVCNDYNTYATSVYNVLVWLWEEWPFVQWQREGWSVSWELQTPSSGTQPLQRGEVKMMNCCMREARTEVSPLMSGGLEWQENVAWTCEGKSLVGGYEKRSRDEGWGQEEKGVRYRGIRYFATNCSGL